MQPCGHCPRAKRRTLALLRAAVSFPSPRPSPLGRVEPFSAPRTIRARRLSSARGALFPLPEGEGQGEGKRREPPSLVSDHSRNCRTGRNAFRKFDGAPLKAASQRRKTLAHGVSRGAASVETSPGGAKDSPTQRGRHLFRPSGASMSVVEERSQGCRPGPRSTAPPGL